MQLVQERPPGRDTRLQASAPEGSHYDYPGNYAFRLTTPEVGISGIIVSP
jgi:hypothetical protein